MTLFWILLLTAWIINLASLCYGALSLWKINHAQQNSEAITETKRRSIVSLIMLDIGFLLVNILSLMTLLQMEKK